VEVKSIVRILSTSSAGSSCGDAHGWTVVASFLPVSLLHYGDVSGSVMGCRAWLALVASPDEHGVAQRAGLYPAAMPPSVVEP
jgi:hypothetical protein